MATRTAVVFLVVGYVAAHLVWLGLAHVVERRRRTAHILARLTPAPAERPVARGDSAVVPPAAGRASAASRGVDELQIEDFARFAETCDYPTLPEHAVRRI